MDLIKALDTEIWQCAESTRLQDLIPYTIVRKDRCSTTEEGSYMYAIKEVKDEGGKLALVVLEGATGKKDPLDQVRNVQLRIDNNRITAINLDGEAVQRIQRHA